MKEQPSEGTTPQAERPNEIVSEMLKLPCGCNADTDDPKGPIFWNPFNKAVQCHKCGHSYELARAVAPVETPEVELQTLLDAGFNGFAVQLLAEELTRKKDFDTWTTPIRFTFRGVRFTLEKVL